jgi:hypothetical protein
VYNRFHRPTEAEDVSCALPPVFCRKRKGGVFTTLKIEQKKQIVEEIRDKFARSKVVIVTDYKGLDVAAINDLRRKLREADVEYQVVKNTLLPSQPRAPT